MTDVPPGAEFGRPQWVFGTRLVGAGRGRPDGRVVYPGGPLASGDTRYDRRARSLRWPTSSSPASGWLRRPRTRWSSPDRRKAPDAVVRLELATGLVETLRPSSSVDSPPALLSAPESVEFDSADGRSTHAFYYPPRNTALHGAGGERPPLVLISHGGPTTATSAHPGSQGAVLDEPRVRRGRRELRRQFRLRPRVPAAPQREVGHSSTSMTWWRRRTFSSPPGKADPRSPHDSRRQRRRLHDPGRPDVPSRRLHSRRQLLRDQRHRSPRARYPQVRVTLSRHARSGPIRRRKRSIAHGRPYISSTGSRAR